MAAKSNIIQAVFAWRTLTAIQKASWNTFATTYPQPAKSDPAVFLSGYQLFVKRNTYEFLQDGPGAQIITSPMLESIPDPDFTIRIVQDGPCIDLTQLYIDRFGLLPEPGQFLICRILPMATDSGQFFTPLQTTIEVEAVYLDGMFASFEFLGAVAGLSFLFYLSKPVWESKQYQASKFRYMGCFKPTQFIQLSDTPDDYTGQAGKIPAVNALEDALEFIDPGGGGINCDDLLDCSIIQQMLTQLEAISAIISEEFNTAIPQVLNGLLYNFFAVVNPAKITSSDDWQFLNFSEGSALRTYLGGTSIAGCKMRLTGTDFWNAPNTCATNEAKTNFRGTGFRSATGPFSSMLTFGDFWTNQQSSATHAYYFRLAYNNGNIGAGLSYKQDGKTLFIRKSAPGVADGTPGIYIGNDGRIYRTICINEYMYSSDPLAETKYRDGSLIQEITANAAWQADTVGALCAYNNDWSNV